MESKRRGRHTTTIATECRLNVIYDQEEGNGAKDDGVSEEGEVEETEGTVEVGSKRQIPNSGRGSPRKNRRGCPLG